MEKKDLPTISASPKTRKFAREVGADLRLIKGSQREGRISEEDVKTFVKNSFSEVTTKKNETKLAEYNHSDFGDIEKKSLPRIKKIAGPHLQKSWNEIPHVTQHDEADITEMELFRKSLRDLYSGEKISITPLAFIIRAVVKALKDYPNFNTSLDLKKDQIIYKKYYHIGIAVDTPHGLMVPKIRDAEKKDITALGKELKKISKLSAELKIDKREFFGGSMTISSLGSIGGSFFTPIINQPEVAILGVGKAEKKQVFIKDKYESRIMLPLSLSYDHRVIDGAEGARFCSHLKESLGKDFAYKLAV
ncbi:MAG: dihydrolipoamide acetyltransferase [Candidatus Pelagibacter sp. TMED64]|nr:dihydrolipoamide acetyltransferase [Candidatus Pelagibacter sp.]OUU66197.1 MAG: dihydrolipoamide acetyltransferase [Candidatus Pelagibacter sp. TMED64]|tara:strand:+ start:15279 stop:16193 length:915 start_codon:yes stop_codon:yes gene_type:complete